MEETFHIDTVCHSGRPSDPRSAKETACYDLLDSLGIAYERVDHDAAMTMELCHAAEGVLHISICKNLFLCNRQKTKFYLLLMPGNKKFKTAVLSKQIGSARLSFGEPEFMEQLMDLTPGSVTVLGLMNDAENKIRLLIDRDVIENHAFIGCHPCINTSSLKLKTQDLITKILPAIHHDYTLVDLPDVK